MRSGTVRSGSAEIRVGDRGQSINVQECAAWILTVANVFSCCCGGFAEISDARLCIVMPSKQRTPL